MEIVIKGSLHKEQEEIHGTWMPEVFLELIYS